MFLNSRAVALMLALSISVVTTSFLFIVENVSYLALIVTALISFSASYLFIFFALQFFFFKEIDKIYEMLEQIKEGDFDFAKKSNKDHRNLLKRLSIEIYTYANIKQQEINDLKNIEIYRKEFLADVSA